MRPYHPHPNLQLSFPLAVVVIFLCTFLSCRRRLFSFQKPIFLFLHLSGCHQISLSLNSHYYTSRVPPLAAPMTSRRRYVFLAGLSFGFCIHFHSYYHCCWRSETGFLVVFVTFVECILHLVVLHDNTYYLLVELWTPFETFGYSTDLSFFEYLEINESQKSIHIDALVGDEQTSKSCSSSPSPGTKERSSI